MTWWRGNWPLRLAAGTGAAMAVLLLLVLVAAYTATAVVWQGAADQALARAAAAVAATGPGALPPGAALLDARGKRLAGTPLPERSDLAAAALRHGAAFATVMVGEDDDKVRHWAIRPGWDWLHRLFPDEEDVRVAYVPAPENRVVALVGPAGAQAEPLRRVAAGLALLAVGAVPLAAGVVFWTAHRAFQPMRAIAGTLTGIAPATLDRRVQVQVADATLEALVQGLNHMLERLQSGFAAQARFAASAAHELRTPLGALRAEAEVALRHPRPAEEYRRVLAGVLDEAERLTRLTDDLLLLARQSGAGGLPVQPGVPLAALVARAAQEAAALAQAAQVAVVSEVPADLAADVDPIALERVLANLVRNAVQHTPAGGTVSVTARRAGPGVEFTVDDTGPGIPPAEQELVFTAFYRGDAARRRGGTGLGLAIARAAVQAHHGWIRAGAAPGGGARIAFWVPLCPPE